MTRTSYTLAIAALGLGALIALPDAAMAQKKGDVQAVYRVSVTDPATGNTYYVDRTSIRSWETKKSCENQKSTFSGFHTRAIRDVGLKNRKGTPLKVGMSDSYCIVKGE